ncbi:acyl carrier protein [Frondihabitans australicus]|uniref:Holo-[acyl-carrier-protein] synthase n=1 Tax=Frondihabitans australicus TaxID=386892 RepID=A0A495IMP1_9MICO|nr:acyl carrier protein [Frondihabitans australicus]RKR76395.1 holo-[acyl-carrier-protein] synthase [Frondihabitans australicus]
MLPRARIGTDVFSVSDLESSVAAFGDRYLGRLFTPLELSQSARDPERLAARFAGKEAVAKILRLPSSAALPYRDIEIANAPSGAPLVRLHGLAREAALHQGVGRIEISLSHDTGRALATAVTLLTRKEPRIVNDAIRASLSAYGHLTSPVESLLDTDDLYQAGLSSHATVNVMLALEDELDIEFPDELLSRDTFATIAAIEAAARSLVPADAAADAR